jgi:hypothetical protein
MAFPKAMKSETYTESIQQGFISRELVRTYQVETDSTGAGVITALQDSSIPQLGAVLLIPNGVGGTERVWCMSRRPFRAYNEQSKGLWHVECRFSNRTDSFERDQNGNPITEPTDSVKRVTFDYDSYSVPIEDATLSKIECAGSQYTIPPWLTNRQTTKGPIVNSAGIAQFAEKQRIRRRISVQKNVRDWDATWETFEGTVNSDQVTIQEVDADGVRASHVFEAKQLRMDVVRKINTWRDGKLYFAVRFEMTENKSENGWVHVEIDKGTQRRVDPAAKKPPSGNDNYTQSELDDYGAFQSIVTSDENANTVAISEPQPLN